MTQILSREIFIKLTNMELKMTSLDFNYENLMELIKILVEIINYYTFLDDPIWNYFSDKLNYILSKKYIINLMN